MKTLVKNGVLVTQENTFRADILAADGIIAQIGEDISVEDAEVVNARGRYVFAGGVDVHTHLNLRLGERRVSDGFYYGSIAAAFGGTTCIVDHPEAGPEGCSLHHQIDFYMENLSRESVIDFGIHGVFQHVNDSSIKEISEIIKRGIYSSKVYTTYANKLDQAEIASVLKEMDSSDGLTAFHAEKDETIAKLREEYGSSGDITPIYHALSRPDSSEADAIKEILNIAETDVYIVHLSTEEGLENIKIARKGGKTVYAETCPQYLLLTSERYNEKDSEKYIMAPPLREQKNLDALWQAVTDGDIDVIGTDHCSFSHTDKIRFGKGDFRETPGGCPGVETRIPLLYSEGVVKGRISLNRFAELISANPAKIMGLYPKKGTIEIGSDADLFILDKEVKKTVTHENLHQKCDYTPFEGFEVTGWPVTTILRGRVIVEDGKFKGERGGGEFVPRFKR